jgi:hypothetical protein
MRRLGQSSAGARFLSRTSLRGNPLPRLAYAVWEVSRIPRRPGAAGATSVAAARGSGDADEGTGTTRRGRSPPNCSSLRTTNPQFLRAARRFPRVPRRPRGADATLVAASPRRASVVIPPCRGRPREGAGRYFGSSPPRRGRGPAAGITSPLVIALAAPASGSGRSASEGAWRGDGTHRGMCVAVCMAVRVAV